MTGVKLAFKPSFGSFSTCGERHTSRCSVAKSRWSANCKHTGGEPLFMRVFEDWAKLILLILRLSRGVIPVKNE